MTAATDQASVASHVLAEHGCTFAAEAGIELRDEPDTLWQLLVLTQLLSARIRAEVAVATAQQLWRAGWTSPAAMRAGTWQQRVDALGRGGYRRYDFSTATRLGANLTHLRERWQDDLRGLHREAGGDARAAAALLQEFDGIGPTGAAVFCREVQSVWPDLAPIADARVLAGARRLGLPQTAHELAALVEPDDLARFFAALVRAGRAT